MLVTNLVKETNTTVKMKCSNQVRTRKKGQGKLAIFYLHFLMEPNNWIDSRIVLCNSILNNLDL